MKRAYGIRHIDVCLLYVALQPSIIEPDLNAVPTRQTPTKDLQPIFAELSAALNLEPPGGMRICRK
jgi:hypothetical protein